jgi:hypothetical protein
VIPLTGSTAYAPLTYFLVALTTAAFAVEAWALGDALFRPSDTFTAAGKRTKGFWLLLLGVASLFGLFGVLYGAIFLTDILGMLFIAAFVAAGVYMADVRPKVKELHQRKRGRGSSSSFDGPYGRW